MRLVTLTVFYMKMIKIMLMLIPIFSILCGCTQVDMPLHTENHETIYEPFPTDDRETADDDALIESAEVIEEVAENECNNPESNIVIINDDAFINYDIISETHEILEYNICDKVYSIFHDPWLCEQLARDIKGTEESLDFQEECAREDRYPKDFQYYAGYRREAAMDYFLFDLNDDGIDEYIVSYSGGGWDGSAGNHVSIYQKTEDDNLEEIFQVTATLYNYGDDYWPIAVLNEKTDGFYDIIFPWSYNRIWKFDEERRWYDSEGFSFSEQYPDSAVTSPRKQTPPKPKWGNFEYEIADNYVVLTGYNGGESEVEIPETIDGMEVRVIGSKAFYDNDKIIRINIPNTVVELAKNAITNCANLEYVRVPLSVRTVGDHAIYNNKWNGDIVDDFVIVGNVLVGYNGISRNIVIPDGVVVIKGEHPYSSPVINVPLLQSVTFPPSVEVIGDYAFDDKNIKELHFSEGLKEIGKEAFAGTNISGLRLPDSVERIGARAFYDSRNLTDLYIPEGVVEIAEETFAKCRRLENVTILCDEEAISEDAFAYSREFERRDRNNAVLPDTGRPPSSANLTGLSENEIIELLCDQIKAINFRVREHPFNTEIYDAAMNRKYKEAFVEFLRGRKPFTYYWKHFMVDSYVKEVFPLSRWRWGAALDKVRDMEKNTSDEEFFEFLKGAKYQYMDFNGDGFPELLLHSEVHSETVLLTYEPEEDRIYYIEGFYGVHSGTYYLSPGQVFFHDISDDGDKDIYGYFSYDSNYNKVERFEVEFPFRESQDDPSYCKIKMYGDFPIMDIGMENVNVLEGFLSTLETISSIEMVSFEDVFMDTW